MAERFGFNDLNDGADCLRCRLGSLLFHRGTMRMFGRQQQPPNQTVDERHHHQTVAQQTV